jgi:hypothetical protein
VEVAAGGPGGGPVSEKRSRVRLNVALYVAVVLCLCAVALIGFVTLRQVGDQSDVAPDGFLDRAGAFLSDRQPPVSDSRAGEQVGDRTITALAEAPRSDQEQRAVVIEAATKMANAFLNISYKSVESTFAAVRSMATGDFEKQYDQSTDGLAKLTKRAHSVQKSEVVWAGIDQIDDDSATVLVATNGTVINDTTHGKPVTRNYRLQLGMTLEDGKWLTRDVQFVETLQ